MYVCTFDCNILNVPIIVKLIKGYAIGFYSYCDWKLSLIIQLCNELHNDSQKQRGICIIVNINNVSKLGACDVGNSNTIISIDANIK